MVFGSSLHTATTSTSRTSVRSVTRHADADGSDSPAESDGGEGLDLENEILSLTSKLATGRGSLDISMQTAESQLTAEVKMEDIVYDLKIYNKEDIRRLPEGSMVHGSKCEITRHDIEEWGSQSNFTETETDTRVPLDWPKSMMELLTFFPCCPPDAFTNVQQSYDNSFVNYLPDQHKIITIAIRNWSAKLRQWRVSDFIEYYTDPRVKPYFNAYARPIDGYYYDVEFSLEIAVELLLYQFDGEHELVQKFLQNLYNVLDFVIPKFNSMCVKSLLSALKKFFSGI